MSLLCALVTCGSLERHLNCVALAIASANTFQRELMSGTTVATSHANWQRFFGLWVQNQIALVFKPETLKRSPDVARACVIDVRPPR